MDYDALYKLTHGLYVLGARDGIKFAGSIVDAVMQVANKPWVIAVSCTNTSYTKECIDKDKEFSLSVLSKKVNPFIIANFGFQSSRNVNKWEKIDYCVLDGLPYLKENLATLRCKVIQEVIFESNTLFIAEVKDCINNQNEEALTYNDYRSHFKNEVIKSFEEMKKGNIPDDVKPKQEAEAKEASMIEGVPATTDAAAVSQAADAQKHWVCSVCDYVYDGEIPFEDLPADWACPVCGVDKSFFVLK